MAAYNKTVVGISVACVILVGLFTFAYKNGIHNAFGELQIESLQKLVQRPQQSQHSDLSAKLRLQRNELSRLTNDIKKKFGQQNCELIKLKNQGNDLKAVSEFGGWCKSDSAPNR